ncbi:MAG TPA: DNA-directed RNA polymerase subunit B, partial [Methanoculleus sp.]|nr:DNA-directed RNA polymerase subunit B [Methanoculleus sp.]
MRQSRVFVDGALIGLVDDPRDLVGRMREMRRRGELSSEINVSYKEFNNDVIIHTDRGRARRPLIVVRNGKPQVTDDEIE